MIHPADGNTNLPGHKNSGSATLKHLLGVQAFAHLESDERGRLESVRWAVKAVDKSCALIDQGDDREMVCVLLSGWAFRFQTLPDGKRQILDFVFAGALIGFGSGSAYSYGVETVTNCTIATMPHEQFRRLLTTCPTLAIQVVERVSDSETRAHEHMTSLGRHSARERIATLIVELTSRAYCNELDMRKYSFDLPVTQIMIGDALALSNEHVCRVLGKLVNDGVIELKNHTLKVVDQRALARETGADLNNFIVAESLLPVAA